jgi:hypothetical protein
MRSGHTVLCKFILPCVPEGERLLQFLAPYEHGIFTFSSNRSRNISLRSQGFALRWDPWSWLLLAHLHRSRSLDTMLVVRLGVSAMGRMLGWVAARSLAGC